MAATVLMAPILATTWISRATSLTEATSEQSPRWLPPRRKTSPTVAVSRAMAGCSPVGRMRAYESGNGAGWTPKRRWTDIPMLSGDCAFCLGRLELSLAMPVVATESLIESYWLLVRQTVGYWSGLSVHLRFFRRLELDLAAPVGIDARIPSLQDPTSLRHRSRARRLRLRSTRPSSIISPDRTRRRRPASALCRWPASTLSFHAPTPRLLSMTREQERRSSVWPVWRHTTARRPLV